MILFCGDTHGSLTHIQREIYRLKPTAVILLGDIEAPEPLHDLLKGAEIYFIPGNHDGEKLEHYQNLFNSQYAPNNLHGKVVEIDGLRIAGLGGVFESAIWTPPEPPKHENLASWESANRLRNPYFQDQRRLYEKGAIYYDDYLALMLEQADILVVHDAPSCHPYGYAAIDDLAQAMGVTTVFHGDHHDSLDYSADVARMGFVTHGVGLRGITNAEGMKIRHGDLDAARFEDRMKKKANNDNFMGYSREIETTQRRMRM